MKRQKAQLSYSIVTIIVLLSLMISHHARAREKTSGLVFEINPTLFSEKIFTECRNETEKELVPLSLFTPVNNDGFNTSLSVGKNHFKRFVKGYMSDCLYDKMKKNRELMTDDTKNFLIRNIKDSKNDMAKPALQILESLYYLIYEEPVETTMINSKDDFDKAVKIKSFVYCEYQHPQKGKISYWPKDKMSQEILIEGVWGVETHRGGVFLTMASLPKTIKECLTGFQEYLKDKNFFSKLSLMVKRTHLTGTYPIRFYLDAEESELRAL